MNLIQKIFTKSEKKSAGAGNIGLNMFMDLPSLSNNDLPSPSSHNYAPYTECYGDKAWVYACVNVIAETTSTADFVLKNEQGQVVSTHPVLDLLYRPNRFMSGRSLRQWIIASLELTGNAYVLKDRLNARGEPRELFPLLSQLVEVIPGKSPEEPIAGYKYRAGAKTAYYKANDIIHFKYFNPFDFFYGLSPLAAARKSIENLDKAETYNRAFFENCGTLSGILYTEGKLDEQTRNRLMNAWNSKYRSAAKAHQVALLEGGLKWQNTALSQKDMDFISSMQLSRETILAVFHVPPALVGVFEHSPQFTTKEQQRIFWQTCIHPKQTLMLETFTEFLLPHFDKTCTMYLDKDTSNISALKEDELQRAQAAKIYFDMGFSKNEIITALGLPLSPTKTKKGVLK